MERTISQFTIRPSEDNYILHFEDEDGETIELIASFDQLDLITEAIDAVLDSDEEAQLGEDGDEETEAGGDREA